MPKQSLARGQRSSGDFDVALTKYRVAVTQTPNNPFLWNNVGLAFFGKKKLVAAAACLKQAIYLAPFKASIIIIWRSASAHRAVCIRVPLLELGHQPPEGANLPTKDEAKAYLYLALSLAKLDDFENSCAAYAKAIEMNKRPYRVPQLRHHVAEVRRI